MPLPATTIISSVAAASPNLLFYSSTPRLSTHLQVASSIPFFPHRPNSTCHSRHHLPSPFVPRSQPFSLHTVALPNYPKDGAAAKEEAAAEEEEEKVLFPPSAAALAAAIHRASPASPVKFTQRVVEQPQYGGIGRGSGSHGSGLVLPSPDFQRLCFEQLELFRMVVHRDAVLSVYVRPAGSYVMDQLELRRVAMFPANVASENANCVILVGNFALPAGLRAAEAVFSKQEIEVIPEHEAVVLPMVKQPFVVGFIVAELSKMDLATHANKANDEELVSLSPKGGLYDLPPSFPNKKPWEIQALKEDMSKAYGRLTTEQISRATMISRSLATAYVMDQKAMLMQQSSWQNSVRMGHLIEQIGGPLSSIRALTKMLSLHVKRSEISYDIVEDILMQGDYMTSSLQKLQEAVYLTKANIVRYNEAAAKKMDESSYTHQESLKSMGSDYDSVESPNCSAERMGSGNKDIEMSMPPLWLMPVQHNNIRPCIISDILQDLVAAASPLANNQQRSLEFIELCQIQQVAVEESALRQALSNLIEGALLRSHIGGKVQIYATGAPAGGALVIIDDDGPDMHYMTQMHSLTPFGADLFSDGLIEDNVTWNFVAGMAVAREILENYGCVMRVISPRTPDAALGTGGTRIELWFPALQSDSIEQAQEV